MARHVTCRNAAIWSRLGGKRTSRRHRWSVENDPKETLRVANYIGLRKVLLDHLVGGREQRLWDGKA
jgi:hypothetical protein